jgi:5-deoxy-glucuronate isomerase
VIRNSDVHRPRGSLASGRWAVDLPAVRAGWSFASLRVLVLGPGESQRVDTGAEELLVLPLAGSGTVTCGGQRLELAGRASVFDGVTDFAYLPRHVSAELASPAGGRFALPGAPAGRDLPLRYVPASAVPVELRGAGAASRQVNNFGTDTAFEAGALMACEVLTPAGNWSSWPPHKHDEDRPGESVLEEIYYFELSDGGTGHGVGYQRGYGTAARPADVLVQVQTGDVVLVPHGWHGPSMAAPGYDLYYLNVMAGPGERAWRICDDPDHAWVRGTWASQPVDPRLPFYRPAPAARPAGEAR